MLIGASVPIDLAHTAILDPDLSLDDQTGHPLSATRARRGGSGLKRSMDNTKHNLEPDDFGQSRSGDGENCVSGSTGVSSSRDHSSSGLANSSHQDKAAVLPDDSQDDDNVLGGQNLGCLGLDGALGESSGTMYQAFLSDGLNKLSRQLSLQA